MSVTIRISKSKLLSLDHVTETLSIKYEESLDYTKLLKKIWVPFIYLVTNAVDIS